MAYLDCISTYKFRAYYSSRITLHNDLYQLAKKKLFTDIQIKIGNDSILSLHKSVLASRSSYFRDKIEKGPGNIKNQTVDLSQFFEGDIDLAEFILEDCIYLDNYKLVKKKKHLFDRVAKILRICQVLGLDDLYDTIINTLPNAAITADNFLDFWKKFSLTSERALYMCQLIGGLLFSHCASPTPDILKSFHQVVTSVKIGSKVQTSQTYPIQELLENRAYSLPDRMVQIIIGYYLGNPFMIALSAEEKEYNKIIPILGDDMPYGDRFWTKNHILDVGFDEKHGPKFLTRALPHRNKIGVIYRKDAEYFKFAKDDRDYFFRLGSVYYFDIQNGELVLCEVAMESKTEGIIYLKKLEQPLQDDIIVQVAIRVAQDVIYLVTITATEIHVCFLAFREKSDKIIFSSESYYAVPLPESCKPKELPAWIINYRQRYLRYSVDEEYRLTIFNPPLLDPAQKEEPMEPMKMVIMSAKGPVGVHRETVFVYNPLQGLKRHVILVENSQQNIMNKKRNYKHGTLQWTGPVGFLDNKHLRVVEKEDDGQFKGLYVERSDAETCELVSYLGPIPNKVGDYDIRLTSMYVPVSIVDGFEKNRKEEEDLYKLSLAKNMDICDIDPANTHYQALMRVVKDNIVS